LEDVQARSFGRLNQPAASRVLINLAKQLGAADSPFMRKLSNIARKR
jgi:hypothetical protein